MRNVLVKPLVTEKFTQMNEKGIYGFEVDKKADKKAIREAVEEMYGVKVRAVRTMQYGPKFKTRHTKGGVIEGRTKARKKAYVQLAEGEFIDFYENI
ncbi:MAG: 50S ribosomal protein L23 [Catalinimonas sp.]